MADREINGHAILGWRPGPEANDGLSIAIAHIRHRREEGYNLRQIVDEVCDGLKIFGYMQTRPHELNADEVTFWLARIWRDYFKTDG